MNSTFADYRIISRDTHKAAERTGRQPQIARETAYYLAKIGKVKTAEQFTGDIRLMSFAMTAFGLGNMAYAEAFVRKLVSEGTDDPKAFANRLADPRYLEFARTFDFKRYGPATTTFGAARQEVVDKYVRQALEAQAGANNEGVRLALYFERNAPKLESVTQILADKAMTQVVRTALALPDSFSLYGIDKQIAILEQRIDMAAFRDGMALRKFVERFSALWDAGRGSAQSAMVETLFGSRGLSSPTDASLAILTNLRAGR